MNTLYRHHISVDGQRIEFTTSEAGPGELLVDAPGVMPFSAASLGEARDTVRSLFAQEAQA